MVWHVIVHVPNPDEFEAALIHPKNVTAPRSGDNILSDLFPSLQVSEPTALSVVLDQVNKTEIRKEVCHALALRAPGII